jgi:hypothetical protein
VRASAGKVFGNCGGIFGRSSAVIGSRGRRDLPAGGSPRARLLPAPVTVDPDIPRRVAQVRHDIEDLYALQTTANDALNTLNGQQRRLASRVEEVQQTLDLHGGRSIESKTTNAVSPNNLLACLTSWPKC